VTLKSRLRVTQDHWKRNVGTIGHIIHDLLLVELFNVKYCIVAAFAIYVDDITNCLSFGQKPLIIMYADDIILVSPSVCVLQKLLYKCEQELNWLGMTINVKKSCCMRVGACCGAVCTNITTSGGRQLPWFKEIRYFGIYIAQSLYFKGVMHEHKKSFFRSVNAILGKVGRIASDEVILQLVFSKSMPVLLYGLESLPLTRSDERSLDFTSNRFMTKLFGTTDMNIIKDCQAYFGTQPPIEILTKRRCKFLEQYRNSFNCLCRYCCV